MGYATEEDYAVRFSDEHLTAEMLDVLYGVSSFLGEVCITIKRYTDEKATYTSSHTICVSLFVF